MSDRPPQEMFALILAELRRVNRKIDALARANTVDTDRLTTSPMPASVCPNCGAYYVNGRCESCKWTEPDDFDCEPIDVDATDIEPTQPDDGLPPLTVPPVTVPVDDEDAAEPNEPTDTDAPTCTTCGVVMATAPPEAEYCPDCDEDLPPIVTDSPSGEQP